MNGSVVEDHGAPESWEVADLDEAINRSLLASHFSSASFPSLSAWPSSALERVFEKPINQVDQFHYITLESVNQSNEENLSLYGHPNKIWEVVLPVGRGSVGASRACT